MELDWSTFALEILNFLILVWILKRFLYRPVLNAIERRRNSLEQTLAEAKALHESAEELRARYENRLSAWQQERAAAREALQEELSAERARQMSAIAQELAKAREKAAALERRRLEEQRRHIEEQALMQAGRFTSRLLSRLADQRLEQRLTDMLIEDLQALPEVRVAALREAWEKDGGSIQVSSAYAMDTAQQRRLRQALATLLDDDSVRCLFETDPELIAGLSISIGAWVAHANLRDELRLFSEAGHINA